MSETTTDDRPRWPLWRGPAVLAEASLTPPPTPYEGPIVPNRMYVVRLGTLPERGLAGQVVRAMSLGRPMGDQDYWGIDGLGIVRGRAVAEVIGPVEVVCRD